MIQPLPANFFTCTIPHCLLHIISFFIRCKCIYPDQNRIFILRFKLRLAIDCPRKIPVIGTILHCHNSSGCYLSFSRITLANADNLLDNLFIRGFYSCAHPVCCFKIVAEFIRITILTILCLCSNILPQIPRFACTVFNPAQIRRCILISIAGSICTASICYKDQIILDQINCTRFSILLIYNLCGSFFTIFIFDDNIFDIHAILDRHTVTFEIFYKRKNHALVLIVFGKAECRKIRKSINMMAVSAQIPFHFQCR